MTTQPTSLVRRWITAPTFVTGRHPWWALAFILVAAVLIPAASGLNYLYYNPYDDILREFVLNELVCVLFMFALGICMKWSGFSS